MTKHSRPGQITATSVASWMLRFATRMLARSLNMPEPLVHTTGVLVFAQVQAVETSVGQSLCPRRLMIRFRNWRRRWARRSLSLTHHQGEKR